MKTIAMKFGGSSLADASQFKKVASIIKSHEGKLYVVASAPGKRSKDDTKVTDMLYACYDSASQKADFSSSLDAIKARFSEIIAKIRSKNLGIEIFSTGSHVVSFRRRR